VSSLRMAADDDALKPFGNVDAAYQHHRAGCVDVDVASRQLSEATYDLAMNCSRQLAEWAT